MTPGVLGLDGGLPGADDHPSGFVHSTQHRRELRLTVIASRGEYGAVMGGDELSGLVRLHDPVMR